MKYLKLLIPVTIMAFALMVTLDACKSKTTDPVPVAPTIVAFAPTSGKAGDQIVITGSNFDATAANNAVTIGGIAATVTASSSTSIAVTVPATAVTGKIAVTIGALSATSTTDFTVTKTSTAVTTTVISGELTGTINWTADQHYLLKGYVYVVSGATLNIAAGTVS